ncbi:MAG: lysylphosphatidylglycerol synthase transmembrane domain-containing protein [Desulfuromonadia bacterium]
MLTSGSVRFLLGVTVSAIALFLLIRGVNLPLLQQALLSMNPIYLLPAVLTTFISYLFRAKRWQYILAPIRTIPLSPLFSATIVGYMANNILPARLGELVRAHLLARRESLPTSQVLATLVIDRLWDGLTVLLILVVTLFTVSLPPGMESVQRSMIRGGYLLSLGYLASLALLVILKRHQRGGAPLMETLGKLLPRGGGESIGRLLESFLSGLSVATPTLLLRTLLVSVLIWGFALWPVDLILRSFGIILPLPGSTLILVFLVFAVMVPAAPGYLGTFHLACVYGLKAFRIENEAAMSVAIVLHAINFFPVILAGVISLVTSRTPLSSLTGKGEPFTSPEGPIP